MHDVSNESTRKETMIGQNRIDAIKQSVDLLEVMRSRGVELVKNGKGYKGVCPFHQDSAPSLSVTPEKGLWQCFGCGKGGDAIRFVELMDGVEFKEALERLKGSLPGGVLPQSGSAKRAVKEKENKEAKTISASDKKLLARVVGYYQHSFGQDLRGMEYLKGRGIEKASSMQHFGAGFANGSLQDILPDDEAVRQQLRELGLFTGHGKESFAGCVTFPLLDAAGAIVGLYGRHIDPRRKPGHLYLSGPRRGLVNRQMAGQGTVLFLTESILDALTLYDQGFPHVLPCYGVNGLTEEHLGLLQPGRKVYLCFDSDQAGQDGAARAAGQLKKKHLKPTLVTLPDKDINSYFQSHTPEEFTQLLKAANPQNMEPDEPMGKRKRMFYAPGEHGFAVGYGQRQYQVKGIQRGETQLKATIKASADVASAKPFELSTIDLYSSRSRQWFAKLCADLFHEAEALTREDLTRLLALVEAWQPEVAQTALTISPEDEQLALSFLTSQDLFAQLLADFDTLGVTGEETNKLVGYLATTSRKLADPLSVLIQSRSAAGKSTLQDAILSLLPEEEYIKYTRVTDQALFYKAEDSLVNKVLAIEEAAGMGGAAYSIRNIQSAKKITVAATGKDANGRMKTEEYTVKGPVCVMITTTATEIDQETASRFLFLTIDESASMTEAIHKRQREAETLEGLVRAKKQETITRKHHAAQRLLLPLAVVNPYASQLSYPNHSLRARRDHKKYLGLIRAVTFLHQYQREKRSIEVEGEQIDYIEATLADIEAANRLAQVVLGQSLDELAKPSRTLLSLILAMVREEAGKQGVGLDGVFFTRRMIREYTGWTDWQVKDHIRQLEELEYLGARVGSRGKEYCYVLNYQGESEGPYALHLTPASALSPASSAEELMHRE